MSALVCLVYFIIVVVAGNPNIFEVTSSCATMATMVAIRLPRLQYGYHGCNTATMVAIRRTLVVIRPSWLQ